MKSAVFLVPTLFASLASAPALAQTVEIKSTGQTLVFDPSGVDNIQIKADKVVYDAATTTFGLMGNTKIFVNRSRTRVTALEDEKATVRGSSHVELQLDTAGSLELGQDVSIRALAAALQRGYPSINYRVQWSFSQAQYYIQGTALYDQKSGTLSAYIRSGDESSLEVEQRYYRGVTDEILIRAAKDFTKAKNENLGGTTPFDFRQLEKYGCTVVTVR